MKVSIPTGGLTIETDAGLQLYIYRSEIDGKLVVELETEPTALRHSPAGQPEMRVMVNEGMVYADTAPCIDAEMHTLEEVIALLHGHEQVTFAGGGSVTRLIGLLDTSVLLKRNR